MSPTRLAVLISMLGIGLPWTSPAQAGDDAAASTARPARADAREAVVRALGLSPQETPARASGRERDAPAPVPRAAKANPNAIDDRWDAASLGLARPRRGDDPAGPGNPAPSEAGRIKSVLGLDPYRDSMPAPVAAAPVVVAAARRPVLRQAVAAQSRRTGASGGAVPQPSVEELAFIEPPASNGLPGADRPAPPDVTPPPPVAVEPSERSSRSPHDSDPAPRPQSPRHDDPLPAIADASSGAHRRGNFLTTAGLTIPPDDDPSADHPRMPRDARSVAEDPLLALLEVLPDTVADQERMASRVPMFPNADDAGLSADVFRHVTVEIHRLATLSTPWGERTRLTDDGNDATVSSASNTSGADEGGDRRDAGSGDGPLDVAGAARLLAQAADGTPDSVLVAEARPVERFLPVADLPRSDPLQDRPLVERVAGRAALATERAAEATMADYAAAPTLARFEADRVGSVTTEPLLAKHLSGGFDDRTIDLSLPLQAEVLMARLDPVRLPSLDAPYEVQPHLLIGADSTRPTQASSRPTMLVDIFDPDVNLPRTGIRVDQQPDRIAGRRPARDPIATIDRPVVEEIRPVSNRNPRRRADDLSAPVVAAARPSTKSTGADTFDVQQAIDPGDSPRLNPLQGTMVAVADSRLEEMRGGFETDAGLKISFGIERAVYINGALASTTSLNVGDLNKMSAGQLQSGGIDRATLGLIQSGPNNTFTPNQIASSSVATVIQNTLNGQKIQGVTQINATVNSLDLVRRADVQARIQGALTDSMRR